MPPRFYYAYIMYLSPSGHPKVDRIVRNTQTEAHEALVLRQAELTLHPGSVILSSWIETEGIYGKLVTLWHECYVEN